MALPIGLLPSGEELEEPTQRNTIVLFDMHDDTFLEMMLPSSLTIDVRVHFDEMFLFVLTGITLSG